MAIAIAGDSLNRDYWFGNKSRSFFIYINFLILLLPGFTSIGGLIPATNNKIPSWPVATFLLGLLYLLLAITFFFRRRKLVDFEEFKRLEKKFSKVNAELGLSGLAMIIISVGGYSEYYMSSTANHNSVETWLGVILLGAIMSGALSSIELLRDIDSYKGHETATKTSPSLTPETIAQDNNLNSSAPVLVALLIAIISFLVGLIIRNRDN